MICYRFLLTLLAVTAAWGYDGYGLYRVQNSLKTSEAIGKLPGIDWWSHTSHRNEPGDLMVSRDQRRTFEAILATKGIRYQLLSDNVQRLVEAEKSRQTSALRRGKANGKITFDRYYTYDEMNAYIDEVGANFPNVAKVESIGKSFEGRDMKAVKLSSGGSGKPLVIIDAGIHAREWIAPATALYILHEMTEGSAKDMLNDVDWIIVPLVNPDGYEFSRTEKRMWRKTRSFNATAPPWACKGVDANRNFDFHWMESGASSAPCDAIFAGEVAFSEPETRALRDYILDNAKNAKAYLTLHSYGQYILYPWGYSSDLPDDWADLDKLGKGIRDAIAAVRGTTYAVGSSGAFLYPAAGASDDWAKGVGNVKYVYTIELPGGGGSGFDLPPEKIAGVVQETLEGIKVVGRQVAGN